MILLYADYDFYTSTYLGTLFLDDEGNEEENMWTRCEREASLYIDKMTYGRLINNPLKVTDNVKNAVCAVCDVIYKHIKMEDRVSGNSEVSSFSDDGYSESYKDTKTQANDFELKKYEALSTYILPSDALRYAGV